MRGMLSFLILFLLSKKPMHGQQIAKELEKRKGSKPSPGTIYPALRGLSDEGLVREAKEGKNIVYSLTPLGRRGLKAAKEHFCRTFVDVFSK
ncbi:PadR family transcriptional regulator [Candidatus Parvarchaeota archaeon]|nr:PadR family transcriptional regulator [Candidatus Parvarchaeota archaeon]